MSGFPTTPSRDAFGLPKTPSGRVMNPQQHLSPEEWNLMAWQVAGAGVALLARAWVLIDSDGTFLAQGAAWNPTGDPSLFPETERTATGIYTATWPATAPNELGDSVSIGIILGGVNVQGVTPNLVGVVDVAGVVATSRITTANSAAATNAKHVLWVR